MNGIVLSSKDLLGWDFRGQNLKNADLSESILVNANLAGANLKNANFSFYPVEMSLEGDFSTATFTSDTVYNQWTVFPRNFDPPGWGLTLQVSPRGDFDATDLRDSADIDWLQSKLRGGFDYPAWLPDAMFDVVHLLCFQSIEVMIGAHE